MPAKDTYEPRWPALLAIFTSALLYAALPEYLSIGPRWLPVILITVVEIPAVLSLRRGYHRTNQILGFIASAILTAFLLWSLALLVVYIPSHREQPVEMLRSAVILWVSNLVVFSLWYWRLDGGGPIHRDRRSAHTEGAFLFPQMTLHETRDNWSPRFIDYLFLSFTTSTAFSPTDAPILSRWAKILVMLQASISLAIIALLAARAVNIM